MEYFSDFKFEVLIVRIGKEQFVTSILYPINFPNYTFY